MHFDPVCHKKIDKEKSKHKILYQRKFYYFCSDRCQQEFEKNPKKYFWEDVRKLKIQKDDQDSHKA